MARVPASPPPEWYQRLASALDHDDPAEARAQARALLDDIRQEESRVRERLDMLSIASFEGLLVHVDGNVIFANQRLSEMLGWGPAEILGTNTLPGCVAPEDLPAVLERIATHYEGAYVVTGVRKDGSRFRAELQSKQGHIGDRPVRVAAVRDVTERERTHALLRESEKRFRDLAGAAFDCTVFSRDGIILEVDGDTMGMLGRSRDDMVGQPVVDFAAPSAQPVVRQRVQEGLLGAYETVAQHLAGELIPIYCVVTETTLNGQPVRTAALRDLRPQQRGESERRALEQRLERAQRLDSLGVLAGGIAHDFNNLLVGVIGNAGLLRELVSNEQQRDIVEEILLAGNSAATLTRQMLAYAGQRDLGRSEPVDVREVVTELRQLLGATLSKKAHLDMSIEPGAVVKGDRTTLKQVLMNLLTNASDALGVAAGTIHVRARRLAEPDARWENALGATVRPGDWVLVEVEDSGCGMDETTRGRVFEPFFSTKERGHGLGLAACLGIVSAHGGAVLVESEVGRGSRFSLLLPASEASVVRRDTVGAAEPGRVLVIDDEALVRRQLRRSLELRGYSVFEASGGQAGLTQVDQVRPDLVILDMTMPDLDGAEVLRRMRAAGHRVPVIIASGYLDVSIERRLPRGEFQAFLTKPYSSSDLATAIETALGSR